MGYILTHCTLQSDYTLQFEEDAPPSITSIESSESYSSEFDEDGSSWRISVQCHGISRKIVVTVLAIFESAGKITFGVRVHFYTDMA